MSLAPRVVLPGDPVGEIDPGTDADLILGPGLRRDPERQGAVAVTQAGVLRHRSVANKDKEEADGAREIYWVDCHAKRYVPAKVNDNKTI